MPNPTASTQWSRTLKNAACRLTGWGCKCMWAWIMSRKTSPPISSGSQRSDCKFRLLKWTCDCPSTLPASYLTQQTSKGRLKFMEKLQEFAPRIPAARRFKLGDSLIGTPGLSISLTANMASRFYSTQLMNRSPHTRRCSMHSAKRIQKLPGVARKLPPGTERKSSRFLRFPFPVFLDTLANSERGDPADQWKGQRFLQRKLDGPFGRGKF